jgi:hypothetical protein
VDHVKEPGNDEVLEQLLIHEDDPPPAVSVSSLSLKAFRSLLVENFDILFQKEQIIWLTRLLSKPRTIPNRINTPR